MGLVLAVERTAQPFLGPIGNSPPFPDQECSRRVLIGKRGLDCTSFGSLVRRRFITRAMFCRTGKKAAEAALNVMPCQELLLFCFRGRFGSIGLGRATLAFQFYQDQLVRLVALVLW